MLKRSHYIALSVVILLTLVVLKLPARTAAQLKLAISGLFLPGYGLNSSAHHLTETAANRVVPRSQLVEQIEQLQKENQELRIQTARGDQTLRENARLRQALGFASEVPWKLTFARVVGRDPANWWRSIRIDRGTRDGVATNAPVFVAEGLVGRVSEVGLTQSQVVLLGDPACRVAVLIDDTRDNGVIAPSSSSPLNSSIVDLSFLSPRSPLRAGQRVVTSDLSHIFPKGLLVGHIVDWRTVGYGLYNEARVSLAVNLNTLEDVWVKLP